MYIRVKCIIVNNNNKKNNCTTGIVDWMVADLIANLQPIVRRGGGLIGLIYWRSPVYFTREKLTF